MEEKPTAVEQQHNQKRVCKDLFQSFDFKQIFLKEPRSPKIPKTGSRQHGFQCPFNPTQMATYVIFFYDLGTFFVINMTVLSSNTPLVVVLGLAYILNSAVVLFFAILATKSDPTDPTVYEQRYTESQEQGPFNLSLDDDFKQKILNSAAIFATPTCYHQPNTAAPAIGA